MPKLTTAPRELEKITVEPIQRALLGEPLHEIDEDHLGVHPGSPYLNAHTLACRYLSQDPNRFLVTEPLKISGQGTRDKKLALKLLNQSLLRNEQNRLSFKMYPTWEREDTCAESEARFLEALGHGEDSGFFTSGGKPTKLFTDKHDNLIFIKKGLKIPTALGVRALALNGIHFPAGTLYQVSERTKIEAQTINDQVEIHKTNNISKVIPLRLSAYAFDVEVREKVFTEPKTDIEGVSHEQAWPETKNLTLQELITPMYQLLNSSKQTKR